MSVSGGSPGGLDASGGRRSGQIQRRSTRYGWQPGAGGHVSGSAGPPQWPAAVLMDVVASEEELRWQFQNAQQRRWKT